MFDAMLTVAVHHYVAVGLIAIAGGVILNLAFTAGPEIVEQLRIHKLF